MSTVNDIINQVNSLTGYNMATASNSYAISSSVPLSSGSVNDIINQINLLTGYNVPATNVTFVSGSSTMASNLNLPFAPNENVLLSNDGYVSGSGILDGGSF